MSLSESVEKALSDAGVATSADGSSVRCRLNGMKYTIKTEITDLDHREVALRSHQNGPLSDTTRSIINVALVKAGLCDHDDAGQLVWTEDALVLGIS